MLLEGIARRKKRSGDLDSIDSIDSRADDTLVIEASSGQDTILVPDHAWLQHADFVRQGGDLLLVGDDGKEYDIFGRGGAEAMARDMNVPLLGTIPINTALRGRPGSR